ncbi:hypothetical protein C8E83_0581 [Frondihabitans australicus]|uniref:Uncharacterized protein n=1 Tax=Frondihabitans australicus TaxID=386892 RepID=A0A495IDE8_9MICO|nr:hypothetical protein C8E83_0581 [Frondihabitans australicus]
MRGTRKIVDHQLRQAHACNVVRSTLEWSGTINDGRRRRIGYAHFDSQPPHVTRWGLSRVRDAFARPDYLKGLCEGSKMGHAQRIRDFDRMAVHFDGETHRRLLPFESNELGPEIPEDGRSEEFTDRRQRVELGARGIELRSDDDDIGPGTPIREPRQPEFLGD